MEIHLILLILFSLIPVGFIVTALYYFWLESGTKALLFVLMGTALVLGAVLAAAYELVLIIHK